MISKAATAPYRGGRDASWLRVKLRAQGAGREHSAETARAKELVVANSSLATCAAMRNPSAASDRSSDAVEGSSRDLNDFLACNPKYWINNTTIGVSGDRRLGGYMGHWKKHVAHGVCAMQLVACASSPDTIEARYVSPVAYQTWNCEQLLDEQKRLGVEVQRVSGLQKENADADAAMMGVGLVLFWPALIGLAATKDRKEELGRLKGEYEAVNEQSRMQSCPLPPTEAEAAAPADPASTPSVTPAADEQSKTGT